MKPPAPKKIARCAIYTRKSTEHNLDLEFNSLDAQREACEAYIKSQAHEGWRLVPDHYDDGGLSGGSLDRPALQKLLADVQAGKVDIVVVYKVDRLTRSLSDFAKLVELFEAQAVSFVSVTQSFNTTSSMGRLTLNVLLSFAQFEREVIGERVRDKIAASKRKGIWCGGPLPLGYASVNKKLVPVPEQAERVRTIFKRYLELGSLAVLAEDLDRTGIRAKRRKPLEGQSHEVPFSVGALAYLLKNRLYIGEVVYRGGIYRGDHKAIIDLGVFEAVQALLAAHATERQLRLRDSPALLTGRIFDDRGNRMTPSHANKRGVRYRYYVSHALLQKRNGEAGSVARVPAPEVESLVVQALRAHLAEIEVGVPAPAGDRDLIEHHVERIIVKPNAVEVHVTEQAEVHESESAHAHARVQDESTNGSDSSRRAPIVLMLPWSAQNFAAVKGILHAPSVSGAMQPEAREALLTAIAKARGWIDDVVAGRATSFSEIAVREGKGERHIRQLATLAFVSPQAISAIINGSAPAHLTVTGLAQSLSYSWAEQQKRINAF